VWTLSWENCIYQINVGTILSPIIPAPNSTSMSPAPTWALNMQQCWQMHIRSCPWHLCLLLLLSVINRVASLITLWTTLKFGFWFACSRHIYALVSFHCALWVVSLVHSKCFLTMKICAPADPSFRHWHSRKDHFQGIKDSYCWAEPYCCRHRFVQLICCLQLMKHVW